MSLEPPLARRRQGVKPLHALWKIEMQRKKCPFHPEFMGVCELSRTFGVSRNRAYQVAEFNKIRHREVPGTNRRYFNRQDVERVMQSADSK